MAGLPPSLDRPLRTEGGAPAHSDAGRGVTSALQTPLQPRDVCGLYMRERAHVRHPAEAVRAPTASCSNDSESAPSGISQSPGEAQRCRKHHVERRNSVEARRALPRRAASEAGPALEPSAAELEVRGARGSDD